MKKSYYLFNPGRLSRKDNTLKFVPVDEHGVEGTPRFLPIEGTQNFFVFGSLDVNSALLNFLGREGVNLHFFDYYEHYTGSYMARDYLLAGQMQIKQTQAYLNAPQRLNLARRLVEGASFNMLKNLRYYGSRGREFGPLIARIEGYQQMIGTTPDVPALMGIEGNIRNAYYEAFEEIMPDYVWGERSRKPPRNELNVLVSFGNMLCYTLCLDQIHHTQLNPTVSYLHEPGARRYSLALDLAEIFKPILVDRLIFKMLNKKILQPKDFDDQVQQWRLKDKARKAFVQHWEERLSETIQHRSLGRKVSYRHLVRLEAYKLAKDLLGAQEYAPFKAWW